MNEQKLSYRLERVCEYLPEEARFADIGSDHAYLPCYAILHKKAVFAVAGEVVKGPYESACKQVKKVLLTDYIDVRFGNGLEVVKKEDNLTAITIAGMGGTLISTILENGKVKLTKNCRLILQPNIGSHAVREWLFNHSYKIVAEEVLEEDGKMYEIVVADPSADKEELTEKEIYMGKNFNEPRTNVYKKKWNNELTQLQRVKSGLEKASQSEEVTEKLQEINKKIDWIQEEMK